MSGVKRVPWGSLDWSLPDKHFAEHYGVAYSTVGRARKRYAPHTRSITLSKPRFPWHTVDWKKDVYTIASELGCTPEAVRLHKRKYVNNH